MRSILTICLFILSFFMGCSDDGTGLAGCFPPEKLPGYITPLTGFGQRAEWSLDGQRVYFVDKAGGDLWVVDIATKETHQITKPTDRPEGHGYYRVFVLANGDLLLGCGPQRQNLYFQILGRDLKHPPYKIEGEAFCEGPAVSRKTNNIAWTLPGQKQIYMGRILYTDGKAKIIDKKLLIDDKDSVLVDGVKFETIIETQNWRPPDENELIYSQYRKGDDLFKSEVYGLNITTGQNINYSKSPHTYDEPEGIFPDGEYTLVECDRHRPTRHSSTIDIYKLRLDTVSVDYERLTFFSDVEGFRSSNPVVRDDGKYFVFQASIASSAAGAGCGLYLFDIIKYEESKLKKRVK